MASIQKQQIKRTGTLETNVQVYAKNIVKQAIRSAQASDDGSFYHLVVAKVFMAFMVEGAIDHLGRVLDKDWDSSTQLQPKSRSRRLTFSEKHKFVRKVAGLSNSGSDFQELRDVTLIPLFEFRDRFAHPKQEHSKVEEIIDEKNKQHPMAEWERDLTIKNVSAEFEKLDAYCATLIRQAVKCIEAEDPNWLKFYKKYPHLGGDAGYIISKLKTFWHSLGSGIFSSSPVGSSPPSKAD